MNMMQYYGCYEKLQNAARSLSVGQGKLKERIADAYSWELTLIDPAYMPEHLRQKLETIQNKLTKNHTKNVNDTIRHWRKSKVWSIATDIFYLNLDMDYFYRSGGKK